jgi:hypothetical protein
MQTNENIDASIVSLSHFHMIIPLKIAKLNRSYETNTAANAILHIFLLRQKAWVPPARGYIRE